MNTTSLLQAVRAGDPDAVDQLFALAYGDLKRIAQQRLSRSRPGATLNTTSLVHEAYLRLVGGHCDACADRAHFLALASQAMRCVLIDYVRARNADKRGGGAVMVPLDAVQVTAEERALDLLALEDALEQLARFEPRLARLVEYRFFGEMTYEEIAEVVGLSVPTVKRDWVRARAWLFQTMQQRAHVAGSPA